MLTMLILLKIPGIESKQSGNRYAGITTEEGTRNVANLTEVLNIHYPIISAPMAMVAGANLACAVTKAGGLGLIGGGYCDETWIRQQLKNAQKGMFGIGFISWRLQQFPEVLAMALDYKPRAIMLSYGDISPFVNIIKNAGIPLICQVQTLDQAIEVKEHADIIVAQGTEAGGHGATEPLLSLLPAVLSAVDNVPITAAGGLVDGLDVCKVMSLGAQAVLMGTRFYASEESSGTKEQKKHIIEALSEETVRTRVFDYARGYNWPELYTARALKNAFYQKWHNQKDMVNKISSAEKEAYTQAALQNNFDVAGVFVGEGIGRIKEIIPVAQIIKNICAQAGF